MNILLVCAAGMSTSIMVSKMKSCLKEDQKDWRIEAHPIDNLGQFIEDFDVVMVGPQQAMKYDRVCKEFGKYGKPIYLMSFQEYGAFNGQIILDKAIELYNKEE